MTIIDHNTFHEVGSDESTSQMFLYIRFAGNTETVRFFDTAGTILTESPFRNAAGADFYITDEAQRNKQFGDPRWY